jgi:electron transport complex protein RnfG
VLASAYSLFQPRIQENQRLALERSLAALFQDATSPSFTRLETEEMTIYRAEDQAGTTLGYAVRVEASGYGGTIELLAGLSPDTAAITGIEVVSHLETPGLGGRITEESFQEQFRGLDPTETIAYVKNAPADTDENEIQALSGATISTRAVVSGLNQELEAALSIIDAQE